MTNNQNAKPSEMNATDLPDVPAFQDEFTRGFMESTEPTEEGYYSFVSKTGAYQMNFPEDMTISEKSYNIGPDNRSELVNMETKNFENIYVGHQVEYYSFLSDAAHGKEDITSRMGVDLSFEEIPSAFQDQHVEIAEYKYDDVTELATLIRKEEQGQQIHIFTDIRCSKELGAKACEEKRIAKKEEIVEWLKNIQLFDKEGG
ncbi:hypothetical protein [Gracilibacillus salinarum]|uniref:Uncharacterized protein n=1 Tax=Gracilibacillus salinarum TaxID=2932255 RepID=A0ABY4GGZ7_9BACI|nr:hypothetical protein [Gracilibacillus salinarum]UOQ83606.1 hypothetical protein MUN87_12655 [Gracilibacillus salinarum]